MAAGDVFGEMSLLDGLPRSATVTSLEDCRLMVIGRQDFMQFLKRHADVALNLLAALSQRLRTTNNLVENLSFHHLPSRLARLLMDLGQRHGKVESGGVAIGLRLSQEELGNLVGASRESVNKQLRAWAESGNLCTTAHLGHNDGVGEKRRGNMPASWQAPPSLLPHAVICPRQGGCAEFP